MSLRRSATVATILATAAATIAGGGLLPAANAVIDHSATSQPGSVDNADASAQDNRTGSALVQPTSEQLAAAKQLVAAAGNGARITWDGRFGTPRTIYADAGQALSGTRDGSAARAFVDENRAAFGLSAADVAAMRETKNHKMTGIDVTVINFTQVIGGVTSAPGGSMGMAVDGQGRVLSFSGSVARDTNLTGTFALPPSAALTMAGSALGVGSFSPNAAGEVAEYAKFTTGMASESYVAKMAFPTADGARAAYRVLFIEKLDKAWDMVLDASSGKVLYKKSLVQNESEGIIYPNYPGAPKGGDPLKVSFGATEESPGGYVDPTGLTGIGVTTFGNNADTFKNWSNFIAPLDQANRTVAPTRQFNFGFPNAWESAADESGTIPSGSAYLLTSNWAGAATDVTVTAVDTQ